MTPVTVQSKPQLLSVLSLYEAKSRQKQQSINFSSEITQEASYPCFHGTRLHCILAPIATARNHQLDTWVEHLAHCSITFTHRVYFSQISFVSSVKLMETLGITAHDDITHLRVNSLTHCSLCWMLSNKPSFWLKVDILFIWQDINTAVGSPTSVCVVGWILYWTI